MPGQERSAGGHAEHVADQAGATRQACALGDVAVGRDPAARDLADRRADPVVPQGGPDGELQGSTTSFRDSSGTPFQERRAK
jgi:hypothetical protein